MNNESIEYDRKAALDALKIYLHHFLIPERTEKLEALIWELDYEEAININWLEIQ